MSAERAEEATAEGVCLLERAVSYCLGGLQLVRPEALSARTPCADWDVAELLAHMHDSVEALFEAARFGRIELVSAASGDSDPVARLRMAATRLVGAYTRAGPSAHVAIGGCRITTSIVTGTGALELAVHGWDLGRALGVPRPLPEPLAVELLPLAALLVTPEDRPGRFAPALPVARDAGAAERLLAFLGRRP